MKNAYLVPENRAYNEIAVRLQPCCAQGIGAFTLVECVAVISIIALLAALLLSALAKSKIKAQSTVCLSNLKQMQLAWLSYALEHEDALPPNISRRIQFDQVNVAGSWVLGNAEVDTNTDNLKQGVLYRYRYISAESVFHCPADRSTVLDRPDLVRTRSYSMSLWLNVDIIGFGNADLATMARNNRHKLSQIGNPPPSQTWVFIDEHPLSIDDGVFLIAGGNDYGHWSSYRGDRHNNGANLSFADGHVEPYHWRCHRQFRQYTANWTRAIDADDRADLRRLEAGLPHSP